MEKEQRKRKCPWYVCPFVHLSIRPIIHLSLQQTVGGGGRDYRRKCVGRFVIHLHRCIRRELKH